MHACASISRGSVSLLLFGLSLVLTSTSIASVCCKAAACFSAAAACFCLLFASSTVHSSGAHGNAGLFVYKNSGHGGGLSLPVRLLTMGR